MKKPNGNTEYKIGAFISSNTKRKADLYRALTGKKLKDIYEEALNEFLDSHLSNINKGVTK